MLPEQDIAVRLDMRRPTYAASAWFTARFIPFTGYDPCDGDDPRVTLSSDNPLGPAQTPAGSSDVARGGSAAGHGRSGAGA